MMILLYDCRWETKKCGTETIDVGGNDWVGIPELSEDIPVLGIMDEPDNIKF